MKISVMKECLSRERERERKREQPLGCSVNVFPFTPKAIPGSFLLIQVSLEILRIKVSLEILFSLHLPHPQIHSLDTRHVFVS